MNDKSIKEIISVRHSVRNYSDEPLSDEIINKVNSYIKDLTNPFNKEVRIELIEKDESNEDIKLGTYGVIKGANYYLTAAYDKSDDKGLYDIGYLLEKVVLFTYIQ